MRALRGINPWTAVPLLVVAVLLGFLGGLQLTRALPDKTVVDAYDWGYDQEIAKLGKGLKLADSLDRAAADYGAADFLQRRGYPIPAECVDRDFSLQRVIANREYRAAAGLLIGLALLWIRRSPGV